MEPQSTTLRPDEFHTQNWLLIAEALVETTSPDHSYTNYFENRVAYANSLVPSVVTEAEIPSGDLYDHIDPEWGDIGPSDVDPDRPVDHDRSIDVDLGKRTQPVDSFSSLEWLLVAEALNAWIADLHLGGPDNPPRGGDRVEELMNASVRAAGYTGVENVLPIVRKLFGDKN